MVSFPISVLYLIFPRTEDAAASADLSASARFSPTPTKARERDERVKTDPFFSSILA
jgi:hypothetical protein